MRGEVNNSPQNITGEPGLGEQLPKVQDDLNTNTTRSVDGESVDGSDERRDGDMKGDLIVDASTLQPLALTSTFNALDIKSGEEKQEAELTRKKKSDTGEDTEEAKTEPQVEAEVAPSIGCSSQWSSKMAESRATSIAAERHQDGGETPMAKNSAVATSDVLTTDSRRERRRLVLWKKVKKKISRKKS